MQIGEYNERCKIEQPDSAATVGADGHVDLSLAASWKLYQRVWCNVTASGGTEVQHGEAVESRSSLTVRTQRDDITKAVTSQMRLVRQDGTILDILDVADSSAREEIVLLCTAWETA